MKYYIEAEWNNFVNAVLKDVSGIQYQEMRRAFFGGAKAYSHIVMVNASPGDDVTPEDDQMMMDLEEEMSQFFSDVRAGKK